MARRSCVSGTASDGRVEGVVDPSGHRPLIIGLGNAVLGDDAVGLHVSRRVCELGAGSVDVVEAEVAGFALLDLMADRERIVIVDAIELAGHEAGEVLELSLFAARATTRLCAGHEIDLPTALELGRSLGLVVPARIYILGVVIKDARTMGETLSAPVASAVDRAARLSLDLARGDPL